MVDQIAHHLRLLQNRHLLDLSQDVFCEYHIDDIHRSGGNGNAHFSVGKPQQSQLIFSPKLIEGLNNHWNRVGNLGVRKNRLS